MKNVAPHIAETEAANVVNAETEADFRIRVRIADRSVIAFQEIAAATEVRVAVKVAVREKDNLLSL